jgi:predicted RNA-binding Zn ribbon-like protein
MEKSPIYRWKLSHEPVVDFLMSKIWNPGGPALDVFADYAGVVGWLRHIGTLSAEDARSQKALAGKRPGEARAAWKKAVRLRNAGYAVFSACADRRPPSGRDVEFLNREVAAAMSHLRIAQSSGKYTWTWHTSGAALAWILWPVMRAMAELLTSDRLHRVKQCAECRWMFMDRSRNASRRWCSMTVCGNRVKARRYHERHRGS